MSDRVRLTSPYTELSCGGSRCASSGHLSSDSGIGRALPQSMVTTRQKLGVSGLLPFQTQAVRSPSTSVRSLCGARRRDISLRQSLWHTRFASELDRSRHEEEETNQRGSRLGVPMHGFPFSVHVASKPQVVRAVPHPPPCPRRIARVHIGTWAQKGVWLCGHIQEETTAAPADCGNGRSPCGYVRCPRLASSGREMKGGSHAEQSRFAPVSHSSRARL